MNWLNIEVATIRRPEYVGADPCHRATWWNLLAYCAEQENGGIIENCGEWKCRRWQQTCGVTKDEVQSECDLWDANDGNVTVWGYPADKETEVKAKRKGGSNGGRKRAENAASKAEKSTLSSSASSTPSSSASTEEKRKEEKGREEKRERKEIPAPPPAHEVVPTGRKFPDHSETIARINAVKQEWAKPAQWSGAELHSLHDALGQLAEMTEDDWSAIRAYMAARLPEGAGYWQPRNRGQFIAQFSDVFGHVQRWQSKSRRTPAIPKPIEPMPERKILSREEIKNMMQP